MSTPVSIETIMVTGVAAAVGLLVLWAAKKSFASKARNKDWQPALEQEREQDVHILGTTYPESNWHGLTCKKIHTYTVPKEPNEYAKIFVPEAKCNDIESGHDIRTGK